MGTSSHVRASCTLSSALALALVACLLLAGSALAGRQAGAGSVKPGKPTATSPKGTITTVRPTFTWSKAARATGYELRVYRGTQLQLRKTGLKKRSWTSAKALPTGVDLSWKVRARSARGYGAWSRSLKFKIEPLSPARAITTFSFQGLDPPVTGVIDEGAHTIALTVPYGTARSALVATFSTTGAAVRVGATAQVSGATANDFGSPVTYTVTAADGTTQAYVVTVTVALSPAKAITTFSFQGLDPPVTGVIDEGAHTIALTVPYGTARSALVATFSTTGAAVRVGATAQVSGATANDFGSPVTYTVTAADGTTQAYVVTVTVALSPAKAITTFSFQGLDPPVTGVIDEGAHTIALTVPYGTARSALVATFSTTGAAVRVGATAQVSGATANDFDSPVTYTVTAADGTTQAYVVTVTVAPPDIGDALGGGIVAYVLQPGDPGYVAGEIHGLIAAAADQIAADSIGGVQWSLPAYHSTDVPGAHGTALGTGAANSAAIIAQNGDGATYAAGLAHAYRGGGHDDWFLPSRDELDQLYLNRVAIGSFHTTADQGATYWSSSHNSTYAHNAWSQDFVDGYQTAWWSKFDTYRVRAVRTF